MRPFFFSFFFVPDWVSASVCVCVCVCERERGRQTDRQTDRQRTCMRALKQMRYYPFILGSSFTKQRRTTVHLIKTTTIQRVPLPYSGTNLHEKYSF